MQAAEYLVAADAVWSSDLQRAVLTASIIAAELGHDPVALDPRLRERHAGAWQGLTRDEVESGWPGYLASGRRPPGFESSDSAGRRALGCLVAAARRLEGATALVVSHGGILRAMRKMLGAHEDIGFANLSGEWFTVDGSTVVAGELVSLLSGERPVQSSPL